MTTLVSIFKEKGKLYEEKDALQEEIEYLEGLLSSSKQRIDQINRDLERLTEAQHAAKHCDGYALYLCGM